jgi:hypothetical protein
MRLSRQLWHGKELRFGHLVRNSGRPQVITLWTKPQENRALTDAIKKNKVLTVIQEPGKRDCGRIGFEPKLRGNGPGKIINSAPECQGGRDQLPARGGEGRSQGASRKGCTEFAGQSTARRSRTHA